jgi:hypothetical protein
MSDGQWRKSSYSGGHGGNCVQVAPAKDGIMVRDSRDPDGPVLLLALAHWAGLCKSL